MEAIAPLHRNQPPQTDQQQARTAHNGFKAANYFTGLPIEYHVPKNTKLICVSDFFTKDVVGGAELTTEALLQSCPKTVFKLHSSSVTEELIEKNKDKYWLFGNFTFVDHDFLKMFASLAASGEIRYSVLEYDFKFCKARSTYKHLLESGNACSCIKGSHGQTIREFFLGAEHIFWMSEKQKQEVLKHFTDLAEEAEKHIVLSSVFDKQSLDYIKTLRESRKENSGLLAFLNEKSTWIKGASQTAAWIKVKRINNSIQLPALPYKEFLTELAKHKGFIFKPLDYDTCPRVIIEAKLLGLEVITNSNVLHMDESWFANSTVEELDAYLRETPTRFWNYIKL